MKMSEGYEVMKMNDSSLFYQLKAYQTALKTHNERIIAFVRRTWQMYISNLIKIVKP